MIAPDIAQFAADLGHIDVLEVAVAEVVIHCTALQAASLEGPREEAGGDKDLVSRIGTQRSHAVADGGLLEVGLHAPGTKLPADAERVPEGHRPVHVFVGAVVAEQAEVGLVLEGRDAGTGTEIAIPSPAVVGLAELPQPGDDPAVMRPAGQEAVRLLAGKGIVVERFDMQLARIFTHPHAAILGRHGSVGKFAPVALAAHAIGPHLHHLRRGGVDDDRRIVDRGDGLGSVRRRQHLIRPAGGGESSGHGAIVDRTGLRSPGHHRRQPVGVHRESVGPLARRSAGSRVETRRQSTAERALGWGCVRATGSALDGKHRSARITLRGPEKIDIAHAGQSHLAVVGEVRAEAPGQAVVALPVAHLARWPGSRRCGRLALRDSPTRRGSHGRHAGGQAHRGRCRDRGRGSGHGLRGGCRCGGQAARRRDCCLRGRLSRRRGAGGR